MNAATTSTTSRPATPAHQAAALVYCALAAPAWGAPCRSNTNCPNNGVDAHTMATNPSTTAVTRPGTPSRNGPKNAKSTMIAATANAVTENVDDETAPLPGRQASARSTT